MTVDTNSISISLANAAEMIKNESWLSTLKFPKATFTAAHFKKVDGITKHSYIAPGTLTIKGKSIAINVNFNLKGYSKSSEKVTATGSFKINRSSFGIGNAYTKKSNSIKDAVVIKFNINAKK